MEASICLKEEIAVSSERPVDIKDWNKDHVKQWLLEIKVDKVDVEILYKQRINGTVLLILEEKDLNIDNLSLNARKLIINKTGSLKQKTQQQSNMVTQSYCLKPYPFNRFNAAHRYRENSILDVTETGPIDLIQPCHEFKAFINTNKDNRMKKYTYEVIRFAAACMNSRSNGTIHFGVADDPHGQILGISIQNTDEFDVQQSHAIERHFEVQMSVQTAKRCIKPPRFVEVLKADMTSAGKCIIEVDIEPSSIVCEESHFKTYNMDKNENEKQEPRAGEKKKKKKKKKKKGDASFFIRDGSSSKNLITSDSSKEYDDYIEDMPRLTQLRKDAEEKHLSVVKNSVQGSKLCEMITGGTQSLDRSHYEQYIVVANKSHRLQLENLSFLLHMDLVAVLDFDPESAKNGLNKLFEKRTINVHLPAQYKIADAVEERANKLKLTKITSWVFCNGGIDEERPSDADNWLIEKGSSVHDVVSFLCRKDVLPHKKFLTVFVLTSQVSDGKDPLIETFNMFLQELKGGNQILCISDNETSYTYWKDLIKDRYGVDISARCIYELSFAEVNGTVLSLWSENRKSSRFLPCGGGSNVVLSKKSEDSLEALSVLSVNQCDGGNEDKQHHEEEFYKGGKVSWWNFYFSEQPGSMPFIRRDKLDYIVSTIIPDICSRKGACEFFNIFHLPGCGGTTLAMHVLWTLKDKFRCAVLKNTTDDYTAAAEQVVQLLTYETNEQPTRLPVLLMIDNFQDISHVKKLQLQIKGECSNQNIISKSPQVIIVNCMRTESYEQTDDAVFIGNNLSEKEQELFEEKLKEFKNRTSTNTKTFYGFMILKNNFSSDYIQGIVKNTLKGFNFGNNPDKLFAVLVLLDVYGKNASLSVSACEEFLGLQTKQSSKLEDGFKQFSTLLTRCTVDYMITFKGVRVIQPSIAQQCLKELSASHGVTKAEITNLLLKTDLFYEHSLGKQKLKQDVHNMLVRRPHSAEFEDSVSFFSPLIEDIKTETPGMEETVLKNAAQCYKNDAVIFQLLARYYYIEKKDFKEAMHCAMEAKKCSSNKSYICDTESEILLHQLKQAFNDYDSLNPNSLDKYLTLAESATVTCRKTQQTADKEVKRPNNYSICNTAGHVGELQIATAVIEILQKTPQFNSDDNYLGEVLMGKIAMEDLPKANQHMQYYHLFQKHKSYLFQLKEAMKSNFNFLDNVFVNSVPFFGGNDKHKELTKLKVSSYFQQYTDLFCKMNWSELVNNKSINHTVKIEQTRQCLEKNKGDSYAGLLEYLYEEDSASTLEEIIQQYRFILDSREEDGELMDTVNFIYANVILANIKPKSQYIMPYQDLCKLLLQIIDHPTPFTEIVPLHYITVLLLWQEDDCALPTLVSKIKLSYLKDLRPVSNGNRAAVHFFFGKEKGYGGLISHRDINSCLGSGQTISIQWDDEKILKQVRDSNKLSRVFGETCDSFIRAAEEKVGPMFRCQLHKESSTRVTFFIGFSMNGPVALDIDFET